jgi:hypothetical protein
VTAFPTQQPQTFYVVSPDGANVRICPQRSCEIIVRLALADQVSVIGSDPDGEAVNGSTAWYRVTVSGRDGYVHTSLIGQQPPVISQSSNPLVINTSAPAAAQSWNCNGNLYNCSDFTSRADLMSYWNACPGDPSHLDGNDQDGIPCESN